MVYMQLIQFLFLLFTFFQQMQVQGWAQARARPICHHHAHLAYTAVIAEEHADDETLLPVQRAAGLLGAEFKAAKLLAESADAVAASALLLLSIFDQSHGQFPGPTTRDSLTHRLCAACINYGGRLPTACMGRTTNGSALRRVCDELADGNVAVCLSHTSPHARITPAEAPVKARVTAPAKAPNFFLKHVTSERFR